MNATLSKKDLLHLEHQFWDAIKQEDGKAAARMTDGGCLVVGASGAMQIDPNSMAAMIKAADYEIKDYRVDDVQIKPASDDVAIIAYKVSEDLIVDGKPLTLNAYDSSVWVRHGGDWACALHTESIAGDAYGRDRKQP